MLTKRGQFKNSVIWVNSTGGKIWPSMLFTTLSSIPAPLQRGIAGSCFVKWPLEGRSIAARSPHHSLLYIVIAAGLTALLFLAPMILGYAPDRPETCVAFLLMATMSLLAAAAQTQRSSTRARDAERLLAEHNRGIDAAGGVVLHWQMVNGDLMWSGNAANLLGISPRQVPSNFRDLRSHLHPDDCLHNAITRTQGQPGSACAGRSGSGIAQRRLEGVRLAGKNRPGQQIGVSCV